MNTMRAEYPRIDEEFLKQYEELNQPGELSVVTQLIHRFLASAPERLAAVQESIQKQEAMALRHDAHALKNIAANIGAKALSALCLSLEKLGEQRQIDGAKEILNDVENELREVSLQLKTKL